MTIDPVKKAIDEAKAKAAEMAPIEMTQQPAAPGTNVVSYAPVNAVPATLDILINSKMNVDVFLKVNHYGMLIGNKEGFVKEFLAVMDTTEQKPFYGVVYGNPAVYKKSFDGMSCVQGGSWHEALQGAMRADPKCKGQYVGLDIQMEAAEDIKLADGTVLAEKGTRLGHSTSITGSQSGALLMQEVQKLGLMGKTIKVKVSFKPRSNTSGKWGVLDFDVLGEFEG